MSRALFCVVVSDKNFGTETIEQCQKQHALGAFEVCTQPMLISVLFPTTAVDKSAVAVDVIMYTTTKHVYPPLAE